MKNLVGILLLSAALMGCDAFGKITPESVAAEIAKSCGIVVTIADIAAVLTADPAAISAAALAKKVCDAFNAQKAEGKFSAGPGGAVAGVVVVDGKPVHFTTK